MKFIDNPSPFAIYESGSGYVLPNTLPQRARELLESLGKNSFDDVLLRLQQSGRQCLDRDVTFDSLGNIWDFFLAVYLTRQGSDTPSVERRIEALRIMLEASPLEAWRRLKEFLISAIDEVSGWTGSVRELLAVERGVFRGDDGDYYLKEQGEHVFRVAGARTVEETRLDFLTEQIAREFGTLRLFLNMFSLIAIAQDYLEHRESYPDSMKAVLQERQWPTLDYRWSLLQWHPVRTVIWRPNSNLCDPQWLAGDLLGSITDTLAGAPFRPARVPEGCERLLGPEYERQADFALDTHVRIGKEESVILTFRGREFRWINASLESDTRISVGLRRGEDMAIAEEELNRFLSVLVWEHGAAIAKKSGPIGGMKRASPIIVSPRSIFSLIVEPRYLLGRTDLDQIGLREELILALYREAVNARSVFYAFLNYWKIIEVVFPEKKLRLEWVDREAVALSRHQKRVAEIQLANPNGVAVYLDYSCRSAVAHVFRPPFVDPDSNADFARLRQDLDIVESLAKAAIRTLPAFEPVALPRPTLKP